RGKAAARYMLENSNQQQHTATRRDDTQARQGVGIPSLATRAVGTVGGVQAYDTKNGQGNTNTEHVISSMTPPGRWPAVRPKPG
ncbi:hypothetical protein ACOTFS_22740, partial [Achromobacter xylosoxidans]